MAGRKQRIRVVLDTNVFVRSFKARHKTNANRRIVRLWLLQRQIQLVASAEIIQEYVEIFARVLDMDNETVAEWQTRFEKDRRCSVVNLGRRYTESRDPDDNLMLATAFAGKADYLITNDRDLLDLPVEFQKTLPFEILSPQHFLKQST